jgi:hypothetical protein
MSVALAEAKGLIRLVVLAAEAWICEILLEVYREARGDRESHRIGMTSGEAGP